MDCGMLVNPVQPVLATSLQTRRLSSNYASTSQSMVRAAYSGAYGTEYNQSQAKAVALPWTSAAGLSLAVISVLPVLEYVSPSWLDLLWVAVAGDEWGRPTDLPAASGLKSTVKEAVVAPKPLKLNRDLLLYRAKLARQNAFRMHTFTERLECYRQAEAALHRCIELDPVDARAYVALGKLLLLQRRYGEARKTYEDACAVTGGQNEYIWQAWATLEARAGHSAQARKYYKAAVLVNPHHAASWHAWGMLEKQEGNLVAARDLWVKGIKKTQGKPNPYLYQSLAVLAGEMGFVEEARAWFKQGTSTVLGAQSHALWQAWAQLEERKGESKVVRFLYKKGLEASPRSRYIHLAWAMYEKLEGEVENARQLLQRGQAMNPKDSAILQAWAVLEEEAGNLGDARQLFQQSVDADPQHTHAWQAWGMLELREGNTARARELFQSAVWSNPSHSDACKVWQAWSVLEFSEGNHTLARSMCNCAVKADPSSARAWDSWIYQEEQLGNDKRVLMLRKARASGQADMKLPSSFGLPPDAAEEAAEGVVGSVMNTVREWAGKFESKRNTANRRLPSYLSPPDESSEPAFLEQQSEALPPFEQIIGSNSRDLDLPQLPAQFKTPSYKPRTAVSG